MSNRVARALRVMLAVALVFALSGTAAFAASISVRINAATKVYQTPSTSSRSIKVSKDLKVTLTDYEDGWGRISYKGVTGYIPLKYLDRVKAIKAYTSEKARVYRSAGYGNMGTIPMGSEVYVFGVNGKYAHVRNKAGTVVGYINSGHLTTEKPVEKPSDNKASSSEKKQAEVKEEKQEKQEAAEADPAETLPEGLRSTISNRTDSKVEYTIYIAQSLVGKPYAEKANPPKTFDCARYARYCYGKAQSNCLKGTSKDQGYDSRYELISYGDLKRGDLVCFDTIEDDDLSDHVGIYLGDGYFLHASSAARKIILSSLSSGYYRRVFSWGRRIFES